jgi:repressor LexA
MRMKEKILAYIKQFIEQNKYAPTVREICQGVGLKSTSTVHGYLHKLKVAGLIDFKDSCSRTMRIPGTF